jgi:Acetyltransferase (GNAT) domain
MLKIISGRDTDKWDYYANQFDTNAFWKLGYFQTDLSEGEAEAAIYEDERGIVFYPYKKRLISADWIPGYLNNLFYDITTPYFFGGPIIKAAPQKEELLFADFRRAFDFYCAENRIVSEFVKLHPIHSNLTLLSKHLKVQKKGFNICMFLHQDRNEEQLLQSYQSSNRNRIRKARFNDIVIKIDEKGLYIPEFSQIYKHTMERNQASTIYYQYDLMYLLNLYEKFPNNSIFFYALHENQIVSFELLLYDKVSAYFFLGGSYSEYFDKCPNNLLKHEIALWLQRRGIRTYLLGGALSPTLIHYKKTFAPEPENIVDLFVGSKIHNITVHNELSKIRLQLDPDLNTEFFPIYRSQ